MQTSTATVRSSGCGCGSGGSGSGGCGGACGGSATQTAGAFVRPRFFAGQLLTEDDLQALTGYLAGKDRLRNRLLFGAGVVCGLEVVCDPCGGGTVTVRPGYALDCCGNDIVVGCPDRVDVTALVRDLRVRSLGADCGEPCPGTDAAGRTYGLFIRYAEQPIEPVAPYGIDDSCPPTGCEPSRVRETYRFLVKCGTPPSHRYDPAVRLAGCLGDRNTFATTRTRAARLASYQAPMLGAVRAAGRAVLFDVATLARFARRTELDSIPAADQPMSGDAANRALDAVRAVASAIVRYDLYDSGGQAALRDQYPDLANVDAARQALGDAVPKLRARLDQAWPDPVRHSLAEAVLDETETLVVERGTATAPMEARMLAQGAPLSYALRAELTADIDRLRGWLLVRLDSGTDVTDCGIRPVVAGVVPPPVLPTQPQPDQAHVSASDLGLTAVAAAALDSALLRYVAGCVCASVQPPCTDCADGDVLLASVEVKDCAVVSICASGREQWLPGGPGYAAWAAKLYQARALAEQVCCQPVAVVPAPEPGSAGSPVPLDFVPDLLAPVAPTELDSLLGLLAPEYGLPAPVADTTAEIAQLRGQLTALAATVATLTSAPPAGTPSAARSAADEPEPAAPTPVPQKAAPAKTAQKAAPQMAAPQAAPQQSAKPAGGSPPDNQES